MGRQISQKLDNAISYSKSRNHITLKGEFMWAHEMKSTKLRVYKGGKEKRNIEHIPPQEITIAIVECVRNSISISESDLIKETARLFGLRATKKVSAEISLIIQSLISSANLIKNSGRIEFSNGKPDYLHSKKIPKKKSDQTQTPIQKTTPSKHVALKTPKPQIQKSRVEIRSSEFGKRLDKGKKRNNFSLLLLILGLASILFVIAKNSNTQNTPTVTGIISEIIDTVEATKTPEVVFVTNTSEIPTTTITPSQNAETQNLLVEMGCIKWSKVEKSDLGKEICVFGTVHKILLEPNYYVLFSGDGLPSEKDFRIVSFENSSANIEVDDCVFIEGELRSYGENSFVFISLIPGSSIIVHENQIDCKID
jgi:hypothetical protein